MSSFTAFANPPFELTSNPRFLFFTAQHREALCHLEYGLSSAKPITVLIGDAGTGKSTLLRAALQSEMCRDVNCVFIDNPTLTRDEFVETLAARFDLGAKAMASKASLLGVARDRDPSAARTRRDDGAGGRRGAGAAARRSSRRFVCSPTWRRRRGSCCRWCSQVSLSWRSG